MKISIITSTFNAGALLADTARSLQEQSHSNFEWIVIDGASTDDTVEIAKSFGDLVTILVSEKDSGIYSAWNKALQFVSGEWVLFLGAGDTLFDSQTLNGARKLLSSLEDDKTIAYGDVLIAEDASGTKWRLRMGEWSGLKGPWAGGRPVLPSHPGVFHRRSLFAEGFRFDHRCKISADNEVLLRELIPERGQRIDIVVSRFILGGVSTARKNRLRMIAESIYINMKLGIFFERPGYQLTVLGSNTVRHVLRLLEK